MKIEQLKRDEKRELREWLMKNDKTYRIHHKIAKVCYWISISGISFIIILELFIMPYVSLLPDQITSKFGAVTGAYYDSSEDKIVIFNNNTNSILYKMDLAHELCHKNQYYEGRLVNHSNVWGSYWNEFECYFKGYTLWWQVNVGDINDSRKS